MDEPRIKVAILAFFESYVRAFEQRDATSLAGHIAYPCHVAGDALSMFASREDYVASITPLLQLYRQLDAATANMMVHSATVFGDGLAQVVLHWHVKDSKGQTLYTHEAGYTLVQRADRWAIAAIAFNEMARIRALRAS